MASERRERFRRRLHEAVVAGLSAAAAAAPAQKIASFSDAWSAGACYLDECAMSLAGVRPAARTEELAPPPAKRRFVDAHAVPVDAEGESDHDTSTRISMQHTHTRRSRGRDFSGPSLTAMPAGRPPAASPLQRVGPGPAVSPGALPAAAEGHASASVDPDDEALRGRQRARPAAATTAAPAACRHGLPPPPGQQPFKYVETVRGKEQRAQLAGWSCACCRDFYEAVQAHPRREVGARQAGRRQALLQLQRRAEAAAAAEGCADSSPAASSSSSSAAAATAAAVRAALRELDEEGAALAARGGAAAVAAPILSDRLPPRAAQSGPEAGGRKAGAAASRPGAAAAAAAGLSKDASRHRARFEPDHTPPGFWALDSLPSDAEVPAQPYDPHR
jgi:hypothetical protein